MLKFLYHTAAGRSILKVLTNPGVSRICGRFLDSKLSCILIPYFIRKNKIDMSLYQEEVYYSFNDCFSRQICPQYRPVDMKEDDLIAPCDGLLSAYQIRRELVVPVKESRYSTFDLLRDRELAEEFEDGICLVFRLCVNHYHRYCYPDSGTKSDNVFLPGILHTVRPIALRCVPVFTENSREYTVLQTEHFGKMIQMEVGAIMVGTIHNYHGAGPIEKGKEKGKFLYGGSTIILLLQKDAVHISDKVFRATENGREIPVFMGQKIGKRK